MASSSHVGKGIEGGEPSQSQSQSQGKGMEFMITGSSRTSESKAMAQHTVDARLHADFELSGGSFDYSQSVHAPHYPIPEEQITAYLSKIQRGGQLQPFGCMLCIDDPSCRILAYSENAPEMLGLLPSIVATFGIGADARSFFTSPSVGLLDSCLGSREFNLLNPLAFHTKATGKAFHAILHKIDIGIIIDLEPMMSDNSILSIAGAIQSQKLAVKAISQLYTLSTGNIKLLCDTIVQQVRDLTGYDRVMAYKFHQDEHGEVIAENRRDDLEPYLGLHYPAIDIPQASRYLFKLNKVRMIADCQAKPVRIIQGEDLMQPLCLVGSTLRAPHECHVQYMTNMESIASLVLAIIINGGEDEPGKSPMRLWGLVVCHHTSPRYISFPLRYACEFLMQAFGLQLTMELHLAMQMAEKQTLRTQTLLCDMFLHESPTGIVSHTPSIMDLVKCDGAALYYRNKYWPLGVTPTETQIDDIIQWLSTIHPDSTGLSTDSLAEAGYFGAAALGDGVCGMVVAFITRNDLLFWFRSHTRKEINWSGEKHDPNDKDDSHRMHPRSSFKAFMGEVERRSLRWEDMEMDAIHSLQLIFRDCFRIAVEDTSNSKANVELGDLEMQGLEEVSLVAKEMVRLIETASIPIFAVDTNGYINAWNAKIAELTGLLIEDAMSKSLVQDLVFPESSNVIEKLLHRALKGKEDKNVEIKLKTFGMQDPKEPLFVIVNACSSRDYTNNIIGVCFIVQDVTREKVAKDNFINIQGDYRSIVHSPCPLIPPIFGSDENTYCTEWSKAMEKLTGWSREEMIGKFLVEEVFGSRCRLKGQDDLTKLKIVLHHAIDGQETDKYPFEFFDKYGNFVQALLTVYGRTNLDGKTIGAFCFLQIANLELQQALETQRLQESNCNAKMKELAYICQEIKNPLFGIRFSNSLLEMTELSDDQKEILETSASCQRQMMKIIKDTNLQGIDDGSMTLDKTNFLLGDVINVVVMQVMMLIRERDLQLLCNIPDELKELSIFGDQLRIQQVLATFLLNMVRYTPSPDGWVEIHVNPSLKQNSNLTEVQLFQFRISCSGQGLPFELVEDMFNDSRWVTEEGLTLSICRRMLKLMDGEIQYNRGKEICYCDIVIALSVHMKS